MNTKILELSFMSGIITREQIINWSDEKLINDHNDDIFIELSSINTSESSNIIKEILNKYSTRELELDEFKRFHRLFLRYIYNEWNDKNNWRDIQKRLIQFHNSNYKHLNKYEFEFWSRIKDDYELRKEEFTGCMRMPLELNQYFYSHEIKEAENTNIFKMIINNFEN